MVVVAPPLGGIFFPPMVGSCTQFLGGCCSNTVLSVVVWSFLLALRGKPLPFWRRRLSVKKMGLLEMVQPSQRPVDPSFLLGSPISFSISPVKVDFMLPYDFSCTWIESERGRPLTSNYDSEGLTECDLKSFTSEEVCSTPVKTCSERPRGRREGDNLLSPGFFTPLCWCKSSWRGVGH